MMAFARFFGGRKEGDGGGAERRALLWAILALMAWGWGLYLWSEGRDLRSRRELQKGRFSELVAVLGEYRTLKGAAGGKEPLRESEKEEDLLTAVSNVVASLGLRSNMQSLSAAAGRVGERAVSVTLEKLSSEDLARFLQEAERRGITASSALIRAVRGAPADGRGERSLTALLLLGRPVP